MKKSRTFEEKPLQKPGIIFFATLSAPKLCTKLRAVMAATLSQRTTNGTKFSCCFRGSSAALPHQKMAAAAPAPPSDKFSKTDGLFYFHVSFIIKIKAFSVLARYECDKLNLKRGGRRWSWCENQTIVNCVNPFFIYFAVFYKKFSRPDNKLPDSPIGGANIMFLLTFRQIKIKKCHTHLTLVFV